MAGQSQLCLNIMKTLAFTLLTAVSFLTFGQGETTTLTLDECIDHALRNNIDLKRAKNNELIARANKVQAMMNFLPTLTAGINYDYFFGNFFDQNAARQVSETTNSSFPNLSTNLIIFNGFNNQYTLKRRIQEQNAARAGVEDAELNVKANTLSAYLNAVLSKENLRIASDRVELLEAQLDREEKRVSVGVGSLDAVYNLRSQLSNERINLTTAENTVRTNMLILIQAMQLDPTEANYDIAGMDIPDENLLVEVDPFDEVLSASYQVNPGLKSADANKTAARYLAKATAASRFPTLSAFGRLGSNYSSNGARNPATGEFEENATFGTQLDYNQFEYINFSLNIPIFNRFQTKRDIQVNKIGYLNADLDYQQAENTITNAVQQAYLNVLNAQTSYTTARENLDAQTANFEFIKKRFETGNTDFYSYLESLNNKNNAEVQLVNGKYNILLTKRILDLYRGN